MRIKSLKAYRSQLKLGTKGLNYADWNEHFMGYEHGDTSGFFKLLHGKKPDIEGLLAMPTEMAEDGQAVYEFIQNAADSSSTHFYLFYTDQYLLTINNGTVFDKEGITSVLNLGQSYNKKHDPDKIGRFGIGFKLVHRLIGATSGLNEIIQNYQGPQLFSWSQKDDFEAFANRTTNFEEDSNKAHPWLMKILMTCFPVAPNEEVKDLDYKDRIPYTIDELRSFQDALAENLGAIDSQIMNQGTMIFLKLGEGKSSILNKNQDDINNRLENTLYFLKDLTHIQVNQKVIQRQEGFILEDRFIINPDEAEFGAIGITDSRDKQFPIILQFGYSGYGGNRPLVASYPNFYKFFPMEDTTYGLQFIFHSNVFSIGSNRRHIHEDYVNKGLLELLGCKMVERMAEYTEHNAKRYENIFANLLLSDCSKGFVEEHLLNPLMVFAKNHIPTSFAVLGTQQSVIVKKTALPCSPKDFGIEKYWFKWDALTPDDKELIEESISQPKLGLTTYSLKHLLNEGSIDCINNWIKGLGNEDYNLFLDELNDGLPDNVDYIQFIPMEDGGLKSISELGKNDIIRFPKIDPIEFILTALGFNLSSISFEAHEAIKAAIATRAAYLKQEAESKLYEDYLAPVLPANTLSKAEKEALFVTLAEFKNIGEKTLSDKLCLFCNFQGEIMPLSKMVDPYLRNLEPWFLPFSMEKKEVFDALRSKEYLRGEATIYNDILIPNWTTIIPNLGTEQSKAFLQSVIKYHDLAENPVSLKSKPFIHCNDAGWITCDETVFFHNQLVGYSRLAGLVEIIEANGLKCPDPELLVFYGKTPFEVNDSQLELLLNSAVYSAEAAVALLEFSKGKLNVFDFGYFEQKGTQVFFCADKSKKHFYSSKEDVVDFVKLHCPDALQPLPSTLSAYKEYSLKGQELYAFLINETRSHWSHDKRVLSQLLSILIDSGLKEVSKQFIEEQTTIALSNQTTDEAELTNSWLQLIVEVYSVAELEPIKNRLTVDGLRLSELLWNNVITLEGYGDVELSAILPRFAENERVVLLRDRLMNNGLLDQAKVNKLFMTESTPSDDDLNFIAEEMLTKQSDKLENLNQLRLVLYLAAQSKIEDLEKVYVLAQNGEWYSVKDCWYLRPHVFVHDAAVLDKRYEKIGKFKGAGVTIISKPYFQREANTFVSPYLKDILNSSELIALLELVKDQASKNAQDHINWLDGYTTQIGFNPSHTVFADDKLIHESEQLPPAVAAWGRSHVSNQELLEAIGVHGATSAIVQLRLSLFDMDSEDYVFEGFSKGKDSDRILLLHTLELLTQKKTDLNEIHAPIIKSMTAFIGVNYDLSEFILPTIIGFKDGSPCVHLSAVSTCYRLTQEVIISYNGYDIGPFTEVCQELIDRGVHLVDTDFISELWASKYTKPLQLNEPELDEESLHIQAVPCDLPQYLEWKKQTDSELEVYFIDDPILVTLSFNELEEVLLKKIPYQDYLYLPSDNRLYTRREAYTEAVVSALKDVIGSYDLVQLLGNSNLSVAPDAITNLERENVFLKEQLNLYAPSDYVLRGDLDLENQKDWNLEARMLLRKELENIEGFDCSGWDDTNSPSSIVNGVTLYGHPCIWIVRSAMSQKEVFHLTPYEWSLLGQSNAFLALRINTNTIKIYGIEGDVRQSIFEDNHTINFNFDSVMLSLDGMNALVEILVQYKVWGSGLVLKNPHYSAGVLLQDLDSCKEGIIKKLSDEAL